MKTILIIAALDKKGLEIRYCLERIKKFGAAALLMDSGIHGEPSIPADITREAVSGAAGLTMDDVKKIPSEAEALGVQTKGAGVLASKLAEEVKIHGVLGIGSSMVPCLEIGVMKLLPLGMPKIMVTSKAGDPSVIKQTIGAKDICMFNSVSDVVGLNPLTESVLRRACGAVVGMADAQVPFTDDKKKTVALMAKSTTDSVNQTLRYRIAAAGFEPVSFSCSGYGPANLEQVIADGVIDGGVIELSSDWLDRLAGGEFSPPRNRYENAGNMGLPQVFVPASCDFIAAAPGTFEGRKSVHLNKQITLFRSSREELFQAGKQIGEKLAKSSSPVTVVIPLKGFSKHDREDEPLWNPAANQGFIDGISVFEDQLKINKVDAHITDSKFIDAVMDAFLKNVTQA
jgi:uncharacterized protein (UPF0261 family)